MRKGRLVFLKADQRCGKHHFNACAVVADNSHSKPVKNRVELAQKRFSLQGRQNSRWLEPVGGLPIRHRIARATAKRTINGGIVISCPLQRDLQFLASILVEQLFILASLRDGFTRGSGFWCDRCNRGCVGRCRDVGRWLRGVRCRGCAVAWPELCYKTAPLCNETVIWDETFLAVDPQDLFGIAADVRAQCDTVPAGAQGKPVHIRQSGSIAARPVGSVRKCGPGFDLNPNHVVGRLRGSPLNQNHPKHDRNHQQTLHFRGFP